MADYGLTPQGPNIKRLDVILEEMHSGLSDALRHGDVAILGDGNIAVLIQSDV